MPRIPLLGRLHLREYVALLFGLSFLLFETVIRVATMALPMSVIQWFHDRSRSLFHHFTHTLSKPRSTEAKARLKHVESVRTAENFEQLCAIYGYVTEQHIVLTKDGYLLGLHRICTKRYESRSRPGTQSGKPVVYLHHGLLMNSEIWVCLTDAERSLPFVLAERGYDVWLGNNRGNKYSKKSLYLSPNSTAFWDFSLDDLCMQDIPSSLEYILDLTKPPSGKLSYIGFSQGSAQAFAALSVNPQLNERVNLFIALAPAFSPKGLAASLVDALMKSSPANLFLFFGRKAILPSTVMWQSILYPPIFVKIIDTALGFLFSWYSRNITQDQKLAAYAHLYSYASVKSVVHWFQIMRTGSFQMYDDDAHSFVGKNFYHPAKFPSSNIATPILLLYGESDSLVDLASMRTELPEHTTAIPLPNYEHIDIIWGDKVHIDVIPKVIAALEGVRAVSKS